MYKLASIQILVMNVEYIMKRLKMFIQFFVLFLFLIPFIGCNKDDDISNSISSVSLVPLKVGSQWIYRNTNYDTLGNVQQIFLDTVKISGDTTIEGVNWYKIDADSIFYTNKSNGFWVMYIYSSGPISNTQSLIAKYPAEVMDYWPIPLGIQVQLLDIGSNYSVPAGRYSYYKYSYTDTIKHALLQYKYFSAGTGMIREEDFFQCYNNKNILVRTSELLSFKE